MSIEVEFVDGPRSEFTFGDLPIGAFFCVKIGDTVYQKIHRSSDPDNCRRVGESVSPLVTTASSRVIALNANLRVWPRHP